MTISAEIQSLSPSALVELFVLDMTNIVGGTLSYFHAGTNELATPVIWQGNSYTPLPIEAHGFDVSVKGALPRPHVKVANLNGVFSALVVANSDLVGCKLTRKRTFAKYLDAVNFPGGVNATADSTQHLTDETWYIDRKLSENKYLIEWELASAFDLQGVMLPFRQVIQNSCTWQYQSPQCGYIASQYGYFDQNDVSTTVAANDFCSKRLSSCKCRFARVPNLTGGSTPLPYGGFPGALQYAH